MSTNESTLDAEVQRLVELEREREEAARTERITALEQQREGKV